MIIMGKVYGVISIKGGVGKTTTIATLGSALASIFNKKVLLVDANFSAPNLGLHLGIMSSGNTIHDVLKGRCDIKNAVYDTDFGFHFLPADLKGSGKIPHLQLKKHIDKIKDDYDIVLIDSSPNLNNEVLATMMASDDLLVVTTPDYPTLSCTMRAVKVAKRRKTPILGLILNRVYNKKFELTLDDVEESAEVPVLALLPHDIKIVEALSEVTPATLHAPKSDAVVEYCKLAGCLVGEDFEDPRFMAKIKSLFNKKLEKHESNRLLLKEKQDK